MPTYLVEAYGANHGDAFADSRERALRAAKFGRGVRYVRTTFLPQEETLFHVFEASSPDTLRRAAHRAALAYERIVQAVEESAAEGGDA